MSDKCTITSLKGSEIMLTTWRNKSMYVIDLRSCNTKNLTYLNVQDVAAKLWHKTLVHVSFSFLNKLGSKDLVRGMPKVKFSYIKICDAYVKGKQTSSSFK